MLPYYNVTGERNFYAISVGKYSEFSDVECYQEDAYQLADGFKLKGKFLLKYFISLLQLVRKLCELTIIH